MENLSLAGAMRAATATAHNEAEHTTFMEDLVSGNAPKEAWGELSLQMLYVYRALETAARKHAEHPVLAPIFDERLERLAAIEQDLAALGLTERAADPASQLASTRAYVEAIENATPGALVAHHYVRYLGDLSGGQIIATMLRRNYGLGDDVLNFYSFPGIDKPKVFKDEYRAALDALPADEAARAEIIDNAVQAFHYNQAVFVELEKTLA
ncbi:heme oxygenase [Arcanobacterium wilhelmae]|uniref:heme oxygenase (biliverdin-producing) n=1 Tax=Arcanobacterium wilhelmae TaxID=1803177 RepID=A0ABT9NCM8_9ACTO|nr:biliverdin-producing heme oxygenase [Arcanobacterium wilhelmae]MDP9801273.1 heme oxygenase [Arcanobacterium wilhelmae]WFN90619.1 biliverdin-producing heme oxygenase [Arcanobacterium wilhelmae]